MYQTCLDAVRGQNYRTCQPPYRKPLHARNLKLLDQKGGSAMEKTGSPDRTLHIVRFHAVTVDIGSHYIYLA